MPTNAHKDIELASISEESTPSLVNVILNIEDDTEHICVICLEDYDKGEPMHFRCGHIFHINCILDWITSLFRNNADISCPICRSIECKSNSPLYVQLRRAIFPYEQTYNLVGIRNNEVQRRVQENSPQRVSLDSQQQQNNTLDDGLFRVFLKFVMFLTVLGIVFLFYLIYTVSHR